MAHEPSVVQSVLIYCHMNTKKSKPDIGFNMRILLLLQYGSNIDNSY